MKWISALRAPIGSRRLHRLGSCVLFSLTFIVSGCGTTAVGSRAGATASSGDSDEFYIVDCLLPGQVRTLGSNFNYVTQRRPIKTSQSDCEIRGGEYVAYDRADYSTALRIWLPLAQMGDPEAQTYVGEIYEKGLGLSADYKLAAHWYGEAAKQGFSRAQINLGHLYEKGLGVPLDKQQALNLYRSASGLGGDELMFASTLSASYVPRQDYETAQRALAVEQQHSKQLQQKLDRVSTELRSRSSALAAAEKEMRRTEAQLQQAIAAATPAGEASPSRQSTTDVVQIESYQRDLEQQMEQLRRENSALTRSQQALVEQLSGVEASKSRYQQQIEQLETQLAGSREAFTRSEQELAAARQRLSEQQAKEAALSPELAGLQTELQEKNDTLRQAQVRLAAIQAEREELETQLAASDDKVMRYQQSVKTLQGELGETRTALGKSEREVAALEAQLEDKSTVAATLTPELVALQRELDSRNDTLAEQRRALAALEAERQAAAKRLTSTAEQQASYQSQIGKLRQELVGTQDALGDARKEVEILQAHLAEAAAREAAVTPELAELQRELEEKNRTLTENEAAFAALQSQSKIRQQQLEETLAELDLKTEQLERSNSDYDQQKSSLEVALAEREQQLEEASHQLLLARASLQMERAHSEEALAQQAEAHQASLQAEQRQVAELREKLEAQYALVKSQKADIARLEQEAQSYEMELAADYPAENQVAQLDSTGTAPQIEIIEPPVVLTRSQAEVRVRTFGGERQVIGKVVAPAGLLSLSVNGEKPELTANNLFRTSIPLTEHPTPVDVVLVDNEGRRAAVSFSFVDQEQGLARTNSQPIVAHATYSGPDVARRIPMGDYYALVIGNNQYQNFSTLVTAVNDARETEQILRRKYGFKTKLLLNADRYTILSALNSLRETLDEDDNLLIYYAGHGKLDDNQQMGYWLPVDAEVDNNINWISNEAITDILNVMEAKHILVVADSCYAGTLTQTPIARMQTDVPDDLRVEWVKVMAETRARITLTSGGVEPVLDGGGGQHSVFARAFIEALRTNDRVLEGYSLYTMILDEMADRPVPTTQGQVPQYAPIHLAGHESGEFFFKPG